MLLQHRRNLLILLLKNQKRRGFPTIYTKLRAFPLFLCLAKKPLKKLYDLFDIENDQGETCGVF